MTRYYVLSLLSLFCITIYSSDNAAEAQTAREIWKQLVDGNTIKNVPLQIYGVQPKVDLSTIDPRPYVDYAQLLLERANDTALTADQQYDCRRAATKQAQVALGILAQHQTIDTAQTARIIDIFVKANTNKSSCIAVLNGWNLQGFTRDAYPVNDLLKASFAAMKSNKHATHMLNDLASMPNPPIELSWLLGRCAQEGRGCSANPALACEQYARILNSPASRQDQHRLRKSCIKQLTKMRDRATDKDSAIIAQLLLTAEDALERKDYGTIVSILNQFLQHLESDATPAPEQLPLIIKQYQTTLADTASLMPDTDIHKNMIFYALGRIEFIEAVNAFQSNESQQAKDAGISLMQEAATFLEKSRSKEFPGFDKLLADSYYQLALMYDRTGQGEEQFKQFTKAMKLHDPRTMFLISKNILHNGAFAMSEPLFTLCIGALFEAAEKGYIPAQAEVAYIAFRGDSERFGKYFIAKNDALALRHALAAYRTEPKAALVLAHLLVVGHSASSRKIVNEAKQLAERVYKQSNDPIDLELCGEFFKKPLLNELKLAFKCFTKSALTGDEIGLLELAVCYSQGITPASNFKIDGKFADFENSIDALCMAIKKAGKILVKSKIFQEPIADITKAITTSRLKAADKIKYKQQIIDALKAKDLPSTTS